MLAPIVRTIADLSKNVVTMPQINHNTFLMDELSL